jgi:hypothetical protein
VKRVAALFVVVMSFASVAARAADSTAINGWISDTMCAAKHAGNPDAVKGFYGDHVTVKATADADKKSVHIDSIAAAK